MISPPRCVYNDDTQGMGDLQAVPNAVPNAQAELRGLTVSRRAAVSSSLLLDRENIIDLLLTRKIPNDELPWG